MKQKNILIVIFLIAGIFLLHGCGNISNIDEINADIKTLNAEIEKSKEESNKYAGGLVKALVDSRIEILNKYNPPFNYGRAIKRRPAC